MIRVPQRNEARALRALLNEAGYDEATLTRNLGTSAPPTRRNVDAMIHRSRERTPANALVRLFLLGTGIDRAAFDDCMTGEQAGLLLALGMVEPDGSRVLPAVVLAPVAGLLFASDAFRLLEGEGAADFVMPASTHAATCLRRLTIRRQVGRALDLGCGCGVQALVTARHATRVIATDINERALAFTRFNAVLNDIDNVECRQGDRYDPVAGERFELIVSNPPFVLAPTVRYTFREAPDGLDGFCERLVREAPAYLDDDGVLQMLGEWAGLGDASWDERLRDWVRESGCDAWVLANPAIDPADYVARRSADLDGGVPPDTAEWLEWLEARRVTSLHPGMLLLRRRAGRNWFHVEDVSGDPPADAGETVRRMLEGRDFLDDRDDDALLGTVLELAADLELEQRHRRDGDGWAPASCRLRLARGLPMDADVDLPVMAFLNGIDGRKPLDTCLREFAGAAGAEEARLRPQLLSVVRLFVERGFLVPATG